MFLGEPQFGHLKNGDAHGLLRVAESCFNKQPPARGPVLSVLCNQPVSSLLLDSELSELVGSQNICEMPAVLQNGTITSSIL